MPLSPLLRSSCRTCSFDEARLLKADECLKNLLSAAHGSWVHGGLVVEDADAGASCGTVEERLSLGVMKFWDCAKVYLGIVF